MHLWIEFCFLLIKCFYLLTVFMWIQNHLGNISWEVQNVVDPDPNPLGSKLFYWIRIQDRITDLEPDLDPCLSLAWKNILKFCLSSLSTINITIQTLWHKRGAQKAFGIFFSVVDPDPLGSELFCRIRIRDKTTWIDNTAPLYDPGSGVDPGSRVGSWIRRGRILK